MQDEPRELAVIKALTVPMEPVPTGLEARLNPLPGIQAVLFDIYGTLVISGTGDVGSASSGARADPARQALEAAGYGLKHEYVGAEAVTLLDEAIAYSHERQRGGGVDFPEVDILKVWNAVTSMLVTRGLMTPSPDPEGVRLLALHYEMRVNPTWPMPGVPDVLRGLREKGLRLGIVSNAQFYTPLLLKALLGGDVAALGFEPGLCAWSYLQRCAKPYPGMFASCLDTLTRLGIDPAGVLYIGNDMLNDVWVARNLGFCTALFAGDQRSLRLRERDERCRGLEPDTVVTLLNQIEDLL